MSAEPITFTVHPDRVVSKNPAAKLGLNVNAFTDGELAAADFDRLAATLRSMGVRWLRYPGGEKSDGLLWAEPPYERPSPRLIRPDVWPGTDSRLFEAKRWTRPVLDFDRFIALCRAIDAEPVVVIPYDAIYPTQPVDQHPAPTRQDLIEAAAAWVRYANVTRGYRVRYWEIGNESYYEAYNGGATAAQYATDRAAFAKAMRQADPSIHIGVQGPPGWAGIGKRDQKATPPHTRWWPHVIEAGIEDQAFFSLHHYTGWAWGGFEAYPRRLGELDRPANLATRLLKHAPDRQVLLTEFNVHDWQDNGWPGRNDLGHALVLAEALGRLLSRDQIDAVLLWNTRWIDPDHSIWDAFNSQLQLNLTGQVLAAWKRTAIGPMLLVDQPRDSPVAAFVCRHTRPGNLQAMLINRLGQPATVALTGYNTVNARTLHHTNPASTSPHTSQLPDGNQLTLPPFSLTLTTLQPDKPVHHAP